MLGFVLDTDTCCPENTLVAAGTTNADTLETAAATRAQPRQLLITGAMVSLPRDERGEMHTCVSKN